MKNKRNIVLISKNEIERKYSHSCLESLNRFLVKHCSGKVNLLKCLWDYKKPPSSVGLLCQLEMKVFCFSLWRKSKPAIRDISCCFQHLRCKANNDISPRKGWSFIWTPPSLPFLNHSSGISQLLLPQFEGNREHIVLHCRVCIS